MIPKLFLPTARSFASQGIGALTDTIEAYVEEERNGSYEGWIKYPIIGIHYKDIKLRSIIVAKANWADDPQPFRVYDISKPLNGIVTVRFRHLIYDLIGYPVGVFTASTLSEALSGLISNSPISCPFTLTTTRSVASAFATDVPASIRSWMGGKAGSILDVYGGEWSYDGYTATLHTSRGSDRGVTIRYGKNLTSLTQDENCAAVYTGVYPYWTDAYGGNLVEVQGKIVQNTESPIYSSATYDYVRILPLDLSNKFEEAPTPAQLRSAAINYITQNEIGTPDVNLEVGFAQLSTLAQDRVDLCDTVTVQFERMGVSAKAKCIKTKWDVLRDRYDTVTLGDSKVNIADTIVSTKQAAERAVNKSALETAIDQATAMITGADGGYYRVLDTNGDGKPDETVWMWDSEDIETATKLWRFNYAGLGHSNNGYGGPYEVALTENGAVNASMITVGVLNVDIAKAGSLQSLNFVQGGEGFSLNLETGDVYIKALSEYGWNPQEGILQTYAGENIQTYAGENILAYSPATYTQIQNNADQIMLLAGNAAGMQAQINLIPGQITAAVSALEGQITAELALEIATDGGGNPYGKISANADYIQFDTGDLIINSNQFSLDSSGNATFSGNLSAATGSFTGAVTATSLTLGSGVTVPYSKVSDKPDLTVYVQKDGTIGSTPASGVTGFKVSSAGLLTASNAVIYGTVYASAGTFAGTLSAATGTFAGILSAATGSFSGTISGSTITGSTFKATDGTTQLDNDGLVLRNGATDAASTKRLILTLDNSQYPTLMYQYRASTSDSWTTKRPIGWMSNQGDTYGFSGNFYELNVEQGVNCKNVQVSQGFVNALTVIASRVQFGTTALVDASNVLIAD